MPVGAYYQGQGDAVMRDMTKRYGAEKGKRVFYATANTQQAKGKRSSVKKTSPAHRSLMRRGR